MNRCKAVQSEQIPQSRQMMIRGADDWREIGEQVTLHAQYSGVCDNARLVRAASVLWINHQAKRWGLVEGTEYLCKAKNNPSLRRASQGELA